MKPYLIAVTIFSCWLSISYGAEPKPKECDEATILEDMRESRIEAEFSRRGIVDSVEKITHRTEIEKKSMIVFGQSKIFVKGC
ncbi:MAG TPA: hypothetical protein VIE89_04125 [Candidatus Binatia bacterium]|jgi:hypothetical protein